MPLHADSLGSSSGSLDIAADARWAMAYAAGVPDERPELYDTASGLAIHPMLSVALEWQLFIALRATGTGLTTEEVRRGIHFSHDLALERPLRVDEQLHIEARTVAVGRHRAGATQTMLFTAVGDDGATVWRTQNTSLFLGVELHGEPGAVDLEWPATGAASVGPPLDVRSSVVRTVDAHVYTECARIWNPIHTDAVAARSSGLAAPILHGTATLARAVSIVSEMVGLPISHVRRVTGSFRAPVDLGTTIDVRLLSREAGEARFDVVCANGSTAIVGGLVGG